MADVAALPDGRYRVAIPDGWGFHHEQRGGWFTAVGREGEFHVRLHPDAPDPEAPQAAAAAAGPSTAAAAPASAAAPAAAASAPKSYFGGSIFTKKKGSSSDNASDAETGAAPTMTAEEARVTAWLREHASALRAEVSEHKRRGLKSRRAAQSAPLRSDAKHAAKAAKIRAFTAKALNDGKSIGWIMNRISELELDKEGGTRTVAAPSSKRRPRRDADAERADAELRKQIGSIGSIEERKQLVTSRPIAETAIHGTRRDVREAWFADRPKLTSDMAQAGTRVWSNKHGAGVIFDVSAIKMGGGEGQYNDGSVKAGMMLHKVKFDNGQAAQFRSDNLQALCLFEGHQRSSPISRYLTATAHSLRPDAVEAGDDVDFGPSELAEFRKPTKKSEASRSAAQVRQITGKSPPRERSPVSEYGNRPEWDATEPGRVAAALDYSIEVAKVARVERATLDRREQLMTDYEREKRRKHLALLGALGDSCDERARGTQFGDYKGLDHGKPKRTRRLKSSRSPPKSLDDEADKWWPAPSSGGEGAAAEGGDPEAKPRKTKRSARASENGVPAYARATKAHQGDGDEPPRKSKFERGSKAPGSPKPRKSARASATGGQAAKGEREASGAAPTPPQPAAEGGHGLAAFVGKAAAPKENPLVAAAKASAAAEQKAPSSLLAAVRASKEPAKEPAAPSKPSDSLLAAARASKRMQALDGST